MAYVDLNPIRAGISSSLSTSDFTSIQERIIQHKAHRKFTEKTQSYSDITVSEQPPSLLPFAGHHNTNNIPFGLSDYLELADWSGRHVDPKKTGFINSAEPKILALLGIEEDVWLEAILNFRRQYGSFAGSEKILRSCAHSHGQGWYKGVG